MCSMQAASHLRGLGEKPSQANQESNEANLQESVQATEDSLLQPVEEVSGNTGDSTADGANESVAFAGSNEKSFPNPSVTEYNFLKFKNSFLEAVEELHMRRAIDAENEKRIEELVSKKHELEQKLEEESGRCSSIMDEHFQQDQEIRRQCDEQLKTVEIEKHKYNVLNECKEQELRTLKDELRVLHLTKYNLEKKVQEQERQLHLQSASKDSCVSQMNHLENMCLTLSKQVVQLEDNLEILEHNTKEAVKLNKKLTYMNEHQNCVLSEYKRDMENYKKELIKAKAELGERTTAASACSSGALSNPPVCSANKLKACEHELRMQVEMGNQLENQLSQLRNEHQDLLKTLKGSNSLLERHTDTIVRLNTEKSETSSELSQTKSRLEDLLKQFSDCTERYETLARDYKKEKKELNEMLSGATSRLKVLQNDYTALLEAKDKLEEEKKNFLGKTEDSEKKFHSLMEKFDALVEKTDGQTKAPTVDSGEVQSAIGLMCEDEEKKSSEGSKSIQEEKDNQQPHQVENKSENVVPLVDETEHVPTVEREEMDIDKEDEVRIITVQPPQGNPQHEQQDSSSETGKPSLEVESSGDHNTNAMSKQPVKVEPSSLITLQPRRPLHTKSSSPELITSSPEAEKDLNEDREAVQRERASGVDAAADQPKIVKCCSIRVNRIKGSGDQSVPSEAVDFIHSSVDVDGELPVKRNIEEVEALPDNVCTTNDEVTAQKVKKIKQEKAASVEPEDNARKAEDNLVDAEAKEEKKQTERDKEMAPIDSTNALCKIKTEAEQDACATIMFSDDEDEEMLLNNQLNRQIGKVKDFLKLDRLRRPKKFSLRSTSGSRC